MTFFNYLFRNRRKYYAIISKHTKELVGWTYDKDFVHDVLVDGHNYLQEVTKREYDRKEFVNEYSR